MLLKTVVNEKTAARNLSTPLSCKGQSVSEPRYCLFKYGIETVGPYIICPCHHCADISDRRSSALVEEKGGESEEMEEKRPYLQMARVGVYWQEHQNTSAVSSGTHTAHCDWPDRSQELKPRPLQYS